MASFAKDFRLIPALKSLFLTLTFIGLTPLACASDGSTRSDQQLDANWRFKQGENTAAEKVIFDDHEWQSVTLPHNWGWEQAQKGEKYYRGPGWYRRDLNIGAPVTGRRYFIRFEAASSVADVYLNGERLGQHRGAFGAFCFEITRKLSASGTNALAVRVSNAPEHDIAPLSGDFCVYGGLYRAVHLIETGDINFCLTDHASSGVAWLQSSVTQDNAALDVTAEISNATNRKDDYTLVAEILDASGKRVASAEEPIKLFPKVTAPFSFRVTVPQPHLWNGRHDPYLYRAVLKLRAKDGTLCDSVEQPLGLRYYSVDPDKGFFLNGKPYHLHGVNYHQERFDKGWAISHADLEEDIQVIKDLGCTVVRCAHYQHGDYFYSLCDQAGILVWAEVPQVNEIDPSPEFAETSRNQLLDLVRQNLDHPAIFAWSLFNELWPGRPDPHRELQDLKILANGEDPTRPTIAATATEQLPQMNKIPDWLGWNIYPGWYASWGPKERFGELLDRSRAMSRHGGLCISEYGAGANIEQHEQNVQWPKNDGQWHPEEWQSLLHEAAWARMKDRSYIWGTFAWCMFDFTSSSRHEGGVPGRNDKGLATADHKIKKDAYFFYRANWSEEPTLYITSRRFKERTNAVTDVKIYSNAKTVDLLLDGVPQETRVPATNGIFIWQNVQLKPGQNHLEARAIRNGQNLTDECFWTLKTPDATKN